MTNYEIMFIVKTTMESDKIKKTIDTMKKIVTDGKGKIVETKEMGEKKLAYPIKKELNGYYYVLKIEATPEVVKEFDRRALIDESILRHLIIKLDEE
ncbi:MAG: 30S ribosomal protein S6 [Bacilli bacterium]|jgi:small subunit ribosomal protein S6|nr:30S ribosomal protein S6 [Bacilli bacterium]